MVENPLKQKFNTVGNVLVPLLVARRKRRSIPLSSFSARHETGDVSLSLAQKLNSIDFRFSKVTLLLFLVLNYRKFNIFIY